MSSDPALLNQQTGSVRDTDPNVRQRRASNPQSSVWVNASAGTGKTKVLTDRVLRLLLPGQDGQPGTKPHRILCLTFTKAAAAEMALRINEKLSEWAVMSDEELRQDLTKKLLGKPPTPQMMAAARKLFVEVLDSPGGLNIMTIHAFCQSLLGRFPIEAGLPPGFQLIEETQAASLLNQSKNQVLQTAADTGLKQALTVLSTEMNESQFADVLGSLCSEISQLRRILQGFKSPDTLYASVCKELGITPSDNKESVLSGFCRQYAPDLGILCQALSGGGVNDQKMGAAIQRWIECSSEQRAVDFQAYAEALITKTDKTPRAISKRLLGERPELAAILNTEVQRILDVQDRLCAIHNAKATHSLLLVGQAILDKFTEQKEALGLLDYEDLISKTLGLLTGQTKRRIDPAWVLFKLDGGLDHILIDEAQDTNPEQWEIISILSQEFFSGSGQSDIDRTVFVVGDEKQSIYSFQRAAPKEFERMRADFASQIQASGNNWHEEDMTISFRSTKSVLQLVDTVFQGEAASKGLGHDILPHDVFRNGEAGHAELWPLTESEETEKLEPWSPPTTIIESSSATNKLAGEIAAQIESWLVSGDILESKGRPIRAGDILILVRTRTALVGQLVKALKSKSIPVSGVDRLALNDSLAVQDLLIAADFALLPHDDLALATFLKSPFIGLCEDQLYALAIDRPGKLWDALQASGHENITDYCLNIINKAKYSSPYDFFAQILQTPCPANAESGIASILKRLGHDSMDPVDEFMSLALDKEGESNGSLQRFVHQFKKNTVEIKRELEEAGNAVRIMTVHGAKGLQAPIVFLPDTTRTHSSRRTPRLLWPDKTGLSVPLWAPRKASECKAYSKAFKTLEDALDDEYRRLLYVALTRAEDRIYIAGTKGKTGLLDDNWYRYVQEAFERTDIVEQDPQTGRLSISNPQIRPAEDKKPLNQKKSADTPLPDWFSKAMPEENIPPRPLVPSRPSVAEPSAISPLAGSEEYRYKRGNIIHALLQMLPDMDKGRWERAAKQYLASPAHGLPEDQQEMICTETLNILSHPDFAPIFGPGSIAEAPVTGLLDDKTLISGQIDRLLVTDHDILIVDYKTNRPPPDDVSGVPDQYRKQLDAYARTLAKIYPGRTIKTALLWTNVPALMEIERG